MLNRLLSGDMPRSRPLAVILLAILVGLMTNYIGFLLPTLTQFASIFLMVAVLLWRPQGVYPVANR